MKKYICIMACICLMLYIDGCGKEEKKEWTYEMLQEEFGGIIDTDFSSTKACMRLISNEKYNVCGYVTNKEQHNIIGIDLYVLTITDDINYIYDDNTIEYVYATQEDFDTVNIGDFVYASGTMEYDNLYHYEGYAPTSKLDCENGIVSTNKIEDSISVRKYIENLKKIFDDTFFETEGILIQDGTDYEGKPEYKLYESEDAYKEDKYDFILINFNEEQYNLTGKNVKIIGHYDNTSTFDYSMINCSLLEE